MIVPLSERTWSTCAAGELDRRVWTASPPAGRPMRGTSDPAPWAAGLTAMSKAPWSIIRSPAGGRRIARPDGTTVGATTRGTEELPRGLPLSWILTGSTIAGGVAGGAILTAGLVASARLAHAQSSSAPLRAIMPFRWTYSKAKPRAPLFPV